MPDWPVEKLGDLVDVSRGISYGIVQPGEHQPGGVPIIRVSDLKGDSVDTGKPLRVAPSIEAAHSRTRLRGGELIMSIVGTVGQTAIVESSLEGWNVARAVAVIPVKRDIGPYWIRLALKGGPARAHIQDRLNTTVQATLNLRDLASLPIVMPPAPEREAIAATLGALDDKIELNRKMNATLEAMARALFRDWFVDFGPTRAKMQGREPYLSPDLWALFPDRLDDEGKPEGWETVTLGTVTSELRRGISPKYTSVGGVMVLNQKCIRNHQVDTAPSRLHDHAARNVLDRMIKAGDILVNSTGVGTLGRVAQLWKLHNPMIVDSHVTVVRPNSQKISSSYLGVALTEREVEIEALGEGSTGQTELSRARLAGLDVLIPNMTVQAAFDTLVVPILDRMDANRAEALILAQTRDLLLPRLMSGKLRVADAQRIAEEAH
jgi:type I restriction enzyme S subunit